MEGEKEARKYTKTAPLCVFDVFVDIYSFISVCPIFLHFSYPKEFIRKKERKKKKKKKKIIIIIIIISSGSSSSSSSSSSSNNLVIIII